MNHSGARPRDSHRPRGAVALLLTALTAATALTTVPGCAGPARAERSGPPARPPADSLQGVWQMDGYGTLVTLRGRNMRSTRPPASAACPAP